MTEWTEKKIEKTGIALEDKRSLNGKFNILLMSQEVLALVAPQ